MENKVIESPEDVQEKYGNKTSTIDAHLNYGYALMIIAGADGSVSEPEMDWLTNVLAKEAETPQEVIDLVKEYDYKNGKLEEVLPKLTTDVPMNYGRTLLYNSIRMSRADKDYPKEERDAVRQAAKLLNDNEEVVIALESIVEMEEHLAAMQDTINKKLQIIFQVKV